MYTMKSRKKAFQYPLISTLGLLHSLHNHFRSSAWIKMVLLLVDWMVFKLMHQERLEQTILMDKTTLLEKLLLQTSTTKMVWNKSVTRLTLKQLFLVHRRLARRVLKVLVTFFLVRWNDQTSISRKNWLTWLPRSGTSRHQQKRSRPQPAWPRPSLTFGCNSIRALN